MADKCPSCNTELLSNGICAYRCYPEEEESLGPSGVPLRHATWESMSFDCPWWYVGHAGNGCCQVTKNLCRREKCGGLYWAKFICSLMKGT